MTSFNMQNTVEITKRLYPGKKPKTKKYEHLRAAMKLGKAKNGK